MRSNSLRVSARAVGFLAVILSVSSAGAQPRTDVSFKGACDGKFTGAVEGPTLRASGGGTGTATLIGPFTYTEKATVDLPTGLTTSGTLQLTTPSGDVINASFVGRALPEVPKGSHFVGLYTITGGAGRFRRATGSFTVNRYFDDTNIPAFNLGWSSIEGRIDAPELK